MAATTDHGRALSTKRSLLARSAIEAAGQLVEVECGVRGQAGIWTTRDAGKTLEGVVVTARRDGLYEVALHLTARWPFGSLHDLGTEVHESVRQAARSAGLGHALAEVSVAFEDVTAGPAARDRRP